MRHRAGRLLFLLILLGATAARAIVPGGGPAKSDCYVEFGGVAATRGATTVECVEGTACDRDGACNDTCDFGVQLCLNQRDVAGCTPPADGLASVAGTAKLGRTATPFSVSGPALDDAGCVGFPGGTVVALKRNKKGKLLATAATIALRARAGRGGRPAVDADRLKLVCIPSPTRCPLVVPSTTSTSTSTSTSSTRPVPTSTSTLSITTVSATTMSTSTVSTSTSTSTSTTGPCTGETGCVAATETCCAGTCRNLQADPEACGSCATVCETGTGTLSNTCGGGSCHPTCAPGWDSCDRVAANGCETPLNGLTNCGACGGGCAHPHAASTCATGACRIVACDAGFSNCDGNDANGCEHDLAGHVNAPPGDFLGAFAADSAAMSGFSCVTTACSAVASRFGTGSAYFHLTAQDSSSGLCTSALTVKVVLTSPAGADYDLYVTGGDNCAGGCASTNGQGQPDGITVTRGDGLFTDDSFDVTIEVRFFAGLGCGPWMLTVSTGGC